MLTDIDRRLRSARLGHALLEVVPGAALEVGRVGGPSVVVGPVGHPGAEVLPCQHRGALVQGLAMGTLVDYVRGLGLEGLHGALYLRLLLPPGADVGTGVVAVDDSPDRRLVMATTLCAHRAVRAARAAQSVPEPVRHAHAAGTEDLRAVLAEMRVTADHDPSLHTTVLSWTHRPHPAVVAYVEDAVRAVAAACVVEELLLDLPAS
jgi:hypothetical protein